MSNRANRRFLLYCAENYTKLGYTVGLARKKVLVEEFQSPTDLNWQRSRNIHVSDWDGISIILDGIVCVDFDTADIGYHIRRAEEPLPSTWTERTPRGWHYFYRLLHNVTGIYSCQIGYRTNMDLLVKGKSRSTSSYGRNVDRLSGSIWWGHALVSPSNQYVRTSEMIAKDQLPMAPSWITSALSRS